MVSFSNVPLPDCPTFGCCCHTVHSQYFQPYHIDGHLNKWLFLSAMKDAKVEKPILKEDSIINFIFQDMSPLLFLPLVRVLTNSFHVDYIPIKVLKVQ